MFSTKGASAGRGKSKFISYGSKQILKVKDIEVRTFSNKAKKVSYILEGEPVDDPTFEPCEGCKGQIGTVIAATYLKEEKDQQKFIVNELLNVAIALGVREQLDEIQARDFDDFIDQARKIICCDKYARWFISAREYQSSDGTRIKYNLTLPRYRYVEALDGESRMEDFDKNNEYHYKRLKTTPVTTFGDDEPVEEKKSDDLPF